jgi:hypothetical protein
MKKAIFAVAAAAAIAAGTMTVPTTADAAGGRNALAIGAGVLGAAIIGSAIVNAQPRGGYVVYEGYNAPYPRECHRGYWARQRLYNREGDFVGWSKPHFVCKHRW